MVAAGGASGSGGGGGSGVEIAMVASVMEGLAARAQAAIHGRQDRPLK